MALDFIVPIDPVSVGITFPATVYAGYHGDHLLGVGGIGWYLDRCWLFLGQVDVHETHPVYVVRWAKRMLRKARQLGETEVYAWRDDEPHSQKLLELVGMEFLGIEAVTFFDGSKGEKEVWCYRWPIQSPSSQLQQLEA